MCFVNVSKHAFLSQNLFFQKSFFFSELRKQFKGSEKKKLLHLRAVPKALSNISKPTKTSLNYTQMKSFSSRLIVAMLNLKKKINKKSLTAVEGTQHNLFLFLNQPYSEISKFSLCKNFKSNFIWNSNIMKCSISGTLTVLLTITCMRHTFGLVQQAPL